MGALVDVVCGVFGLVIGSFLNVVIWRVPRDESIARPPSHCPSCDTPIAPRDNVPVVSWLLLRGRCRHCQARISVRYPLVELATCGLFIAFAVHVGPHAALPAFLYLASVGVALAMIDLDVQRLPDALTLPSYPVGLILLGIAAAAEGAGWPYARALIGMAVLFGFYGAVWFVYPAGMGLGDVKLSGVLGLYLGWLSWGALVVGAFSAFLVGAVVSVAVVVARGGNRKTKVPFGPFMLLGVLIGMFAGHPVAHAYVHSLRH
ncbi:MAG TPA: prepilin peptidase [Mycobacteriales bacterium]|nr:prepilin peptidase [Mycobacteriales bacterium]